MTKTETTTDFPAKPNGMDDIQTRPLVWLGSSKKDYKAFPKPVQTDMGFILHLAQSGTTHHRVKPLTGLGASVQEITSAHAGDAYRTVYLAQFGEAVYVLHAFQKKAKRGIATPKKEMDLVRMRLREAQRRHMLTP